MHKLLDALFKIAAGDENAPLAGLADHANVRADAHNLPFVSAARMRLAKPHHVAEMNIQHHDKIILGKVNDGK